MQPTIGFGRYVVLCSRLTIKKVYILYSEEEADEVSTVRAATHPKEEKDSTILDSGTDASWLLLSPS